MYQLEQRIIQWTISAQDVSIIPKIQKFFPRLQKQFILNYLSTKFHSISERVFSKPNKRRATRPSERRRNTISKRNFRVNKKKNSSTQNKKSYFNLGLQLIFIIIPFVSNDWHIMERNSLFFFRTQCIQHKVQLKTKLDQKQEKEEIAPKNFDSIYNAVSARLKTSNNEHLLI